MQHVFNYFRYGFIPVAKELKCVNENSVFVCLMFFCMIRINYDMLLNIGIDHTKSGISLMEKLISDETINPFLMSILMTVSFVYDSLTTQG